jgi:serpin B
MKNALWMLPWLLAALPPQARTLPKGKSVADANPTQSAAVAGLARSSNAFGFDLYQRLRQRPGNLILSPASVSTALTLTWGGARSTTAAQMKQVLHLEGGADAAMAASGELARSLQEPKRPVTFRIANQLFGEKTYRFEAAYLERARAAYGAALEPLDFKSAPEPARAHVNEWVEKKTERRIKDLIPPGGIERDTRLLLVNAIYFLGDWEQPFPARQTRPAPFHLSAAEARTVPTMNQTGSFRIAAKDGVTALEMPYKGGEFSMVFLLPDRVDGLAALESGLDLKRLDALLAGLASELVSAAIPKLEIRPPESLSLGDDLKALGMPLAFDRDRADFTGMANPPDPRDRLVLDKVFHKGWIRVDEKGTEAAAATAATMMFAGGLPSQPRAFKADRPFLFLLRDTASGLVLFLGRVSDPSRT